MPVDQESLDKAAKSIRAADALVIAAGAGMGVDSGLPDFRGSEGFWRAYPALARACIDFEAIANPEGFRHRTDRSWGFYGHRLNLYRATIPHAGFALLRQWGESMPMGYSVFTSNIDGQFQRAGFPESTVHECHGSIHYLQCITPCSPKIWSADRFQPEIDDQACELLNEWPRCPTCYQPARPNVLMFGDGEWLDGRARLQAHAQHLWLTKVENPVVIEIGAGTAIPSVRHFAQKTAMQKDGMLIRINTREASVTRDQDVSLPISALEGLQAISAKLG